MIPVSEALARIFDLVTPVGTEPVDLAQAGGRVLAEPVVARRDQPPFASSAMDGYAVKWAEVEPDALFKVIGDSAAGARFTGTLRPGQAVRIFTGAPLPDGADCVVIQEDVRRSGNLITLGRNLSEGTNVRPAGSDFVAGDQVQAPRVLRAADLSLIAAMNVPVVQARRKPVVALIATGDELVMPGEDPGPDQIVTSNTFGLKALIEDAGGHVRMLPIARDNAASLTQAFMLAEGADMVVTIGGASVGDHDLVAPVAAELGMEQAFYKVAMRPGKPLMAGRIGNAVMLGLPGNPVSALVCGKIFLVPALRAMLGLGAAPCPRLTGTLAAPLPANGPREHYMRARLEAAGLAAFDRQDSSLLSILSDAAALIVRPPNDPERQVGETVDYIPM